MDNDFKYLLEDVKTNVLDAIRDVKRDIEKLNNRLDIQNDKIISACKDIEYLNTTMNHEMSQVKKDLDEAWKAFRVLRDTDMLVVIDREFKHRITRVKAAMLTAVLLAVGNVLLLAMDFIFNHVRGK